MSNRDVDKVLLFRGDISPFLVHLTRDTDNDARTNLENILNTQQLEYKNNSFSDARFGYPQERIETVGHRFFSAVSFTETPINEIHNLLEIANRQVELRPYGLVFLKDKLKIKGVSPVLYLNNFNADKITLVKALCSLIDTAPDRAEQILPYISVFGKKLLPIKGTRVHDDIDFTWEREWRFSSRTHSFDFNYDDVFVGLCPHNEIDDFEASFPPLLFIDPIRNMKWYAEKLVDARQKSNLKYSVV